VSQFIQLPAGLSGLEAAADCEPRLSAALEAVAGDTIVHRPAWSADDRPKADRRGGLALVVIPRAESPSAKEARPPRALGGIAKRVVDIVIALTALILLAPLLLTVSLLIWTTMGSPILFAHRRVGLGGRIFNCWKFRSMVSSADTVLQRHLTENADARREWGERQKLDRDPRVTTLGRLLRRSSIDELPQLLNVLMGHMSCIGPRPIVEDEIARYGPYWLDYKATRPGMTGLWQVSGRNRLTYQTRVALDRHYVRRWSMRRDLWILLRTIPAVLRTGDTA
jgi:exopolysaccharide production protein ExoY